jgi:DNA-binding CsgD family transcriptional regulator
MEQKFPTTPRIWILQGQAPGDETPYHLLATQLSQRVRVLNLKRACTLLEQGHRPAFILVSGRPGKGMQQVLNEIETRHPGVALFVISHWENGRDMANWISRSVMEAIQPSKEFAPVQPTNPYQLSSREIQVLRLMTKGLIKKEIAETLSISYHTIVNHERSIYGKLNVHTRSAAVAKALMERLC